MDMDEFIGIIEREKRDHPFWFTESDPPAADHAINRVEAQLGLSLPRKYKAFLREFGGGDFAFTNIFSVDERSDWYIVKQLEAAKHYLPRDFVAISDDETGGMFGYLAVDRICGEGIHYWDHDADEISEMQYEDLFDYLVTVGLSS